MAREVSYNEQLLVSKIDLVDYYNSQIVPIDPNRFKPMIGSNATGLCPFHTDTDPSFHYWKQKNMFKCFGCGVTGNVVTIHIMLRRRYYKENLTREQAISDLARIFNIDILEEDSIVDAKTPYERAMEVLRNRNLYTISKDTFNLAEFRQLNNKVKNSKFSLDIKVANFDNLDIVASVGLTSKL